MFLRVLHFLYKYLNFKAKYCLFLPQLTEPVIIIIILFAQNYRVQLQQYQLN